MDHDRHGWSPFWFEIYWRKFCIISENCFTRQKSLKSVSTSNACWNSKMEWNMERNGTKALDQNTTKMIQMATMNITKRLVKNWVKIDGNSFLSLFRPLPFLLAFAIHSTLSVIRSFHSLWIKTNEFILWKLNNFLEFYVLFSSFRLLFHCKFNI